MSHTTDLEVSSNDSASSGISPTMPQIGVIALVPDHWSERWQPRHQVMTRLAKYFRVVWMQPPHDWRDVFKGPLRRPFGTFQELLPGFHVYQPHRWLPVVYRSPWLSSWLFQRRLRHARAFLQAAECRKVVLYVWRPVFEPALSLMAHDLSCYHIDDEYTFSETDSPVSPEEQHLLRAAGQVFIHSPALLEKKGRVNPATHFVPNGVDYDAFALPCAEPADMAAIPRPRIGYAGYLKTQLDWSLLHKLAQAHPEYSFVFVGARSPNPELHALIAPVEQLPNTYFLGAKTAEELARYPQHFDVCIMPYLRNDYTKYIYPLKLHEYLAGGKPVVGSRIRSLEEFADVVGLATNPQEWSSAIEAALRPSSNTKDSIQKRQAVAREHDWEVLVRKIADTIAQAVGK